MKLPIDKEMWVPLFLALAAGSMWAAMPWRRRAHAKMMGGKWRRSNAVVTIQMQVRKLVVAAERWVDCGDGDPSIRHEIMEQTGSIRDQITNRLLNLRGFYGLSRRQRTILEEMVRRLDAFDATLASGVPFKRQTDALANAIKILDDHSDGSEWQMLMMRYRFWPFPIMSRRRPQSTDALYFDEANKT